MMSAKEEEDSVDRLLRRSGRDCDEQYSKP